MARIDLDLAHSYKARPQHDADYALRETPSIEHVVVIRDVPRISTASFGCVDRALRRREAAGVVCAVPQERYTRPDPAVAAVRRLHSDRFEVIDVNRYFCWSRLCYPVVGGALVHKDVTHMTRAYAETLGPIVLRAFNRLKAGRG